MVRAKTTPAAKAASPNPAAATFGASSGKDGAATADCRPQKSMATRSSRAQPTAKAPKARKATGTAITGGASCRLRAGRCSGRGPKKVKNSMRKI